MMLYGQMTQLSIQITQFQHSFLATQTRCYARSSTTTTTSSSSSISSRANNSTDVSIIANHPTNSTNLYFIKFTDDTTADGSLVLNGGGIDPTDDPNSKVEILGKEYTVVTER